MSKVEVECFIHFFVVYFKSYLTMNPLYKYKNMLGNRGVQFVPVVTLYFSTKKISNNLLINKKVLFVFL